MKKYSFSGFAIETICRVGTLTEAKAEEVRVIAESRPEYNISPGGEDFTFAHEALRKHRLDPFFEKEYRAALSKGCRESEAHRKSWGRAKIVGERFRKEHPKEALKNLRRASRIARKQNVGKPVWNSGVSGVFHHTEETRDLLREIQQNAAKTPLRRKRVSLGVRRSWRNASEADRVARVSAVAASMKDHHENKTKEDRERDERQLAEARKNINHEYRKKRQKEAVQAYWTQERRAEKATFMREQNAKRGSFRAG